jgi:RND family efflux transporter MFP subunit
MPRICLIRLAALMAAGIVTSCGGDAGPAGGRFPQGEAVLPAVEAVEVVVGRLPLEERLSGSVRARNQTEIYAEAAGTIERVFVDDGDQVAEGDPLVQLRARDFEERVRQAEGGLKVAEARVKQTEAALQRVNADLDRTRRIVEQQLGTRADLDSAVADAISAEADLELMQAQLSQAASVLEERQAELADTLVRAPFDGIVGARNAEVGQQASSGTPLFIIGDVQNMQVDVRLTQSMLGYIDVGTPVAIYSDISPDRILEADISRISPYLHEVTRSTTAEIHLELDDGKALRPGMFVTVDVLYGQSEQAPLVPNSALFRHPRDGREGVYVTDLAAALTDPEIESGDAPRPVAGGEPVGPVPVRFVPVEVVARGRASSGIRGVEPGSWVVTLGHNLLANADEQPAIVQPTAWEHILELQGMQSRDLLEIIRARQQPEMGAPRRD